MRQDVNPAAVTPLLVATDAAAICDLTIGTDVAVIRLMANLTRTFSGDAHECGAGLKFRASVGCGFLILLHRQSPLVSPEALKVGRFEGLRYLEG